jgi:hypothetical protein
LFIAVLPLERIRVRGPTTAARRRRDSLPERAAALEILTWESRALADRRDPTLHYPGARATAILATMPGAWTVAGDENRGAFEKLYGA